MLMTVTIGKSVFRMTKPGEGPVYEERKLDLDAKFEVIDASRVPAEAMRKFNKYLNVTV